MIIIIIVKYHSYVYYISLLSVKCFYLIVSCSVMLNVSQIMLDYYRKMIINNME